MPAVEEKELVTFSAFEGKVDGNTVKGVSIIQEGPALGHGVWVDKKALEQVKKLAAGKGRIKAKLNHWSSLEATVGYYENFRIKNGKVLADLSLFDSHAGKAHLLEMISEMPTSFGVSIMFRRGECHRHRPGCCGFSTYRSQERLGIRLVSVLLILPKLRHPRSHCRIRGDGSGNHGGSAGKPWVEAESVCGGGEGECLLHASSLMNPRAIGRVRTF